MKNWIRNTSLTGLFLISICGQAYANGQYDIHDAHYNFLPANVVVDNLTNKLKAEGVDTSNLNIDADAQGVVNVVGEVSSKQQAEKISQIAMQTTGVYGVMGYYKYEGGVLEDSAL